MQLYYKIWVDCIVKLRSRPQNVGLWKFFAMTFMSTTMVLNFWFISFLSMLHLHAEFSFFPIEINLFPGTRIDAFFSFFISYLLPFLLLNHFLIFYKDRYKKLINLYPSYDGRLFLKYFLGSLGLIFIYFCIAFLVVKVF
ncbi:hypothetical protein [Niabella aquatica]